MSRAIRPEPLGPSLLAEPELSELALFRRKVAIMLLFAVSVVLLYLIRNVLILVFISAVLAAGIAPVVHRVRVFGRHYLKRRIKRGPAVLLVYFPFLIAAIVLLILVLPRVLHEGAQLLEDLPQLIDTKLLVPLEKHVPMDAAREVLLKYKGLPAADNKAVFGYIKGAATITAAVIAILFMIVYMLIDAERLRNLFLLLYPAEKRGRKRSMVIRMSRRMSGWLYGKLVLAAIVGAITLVALLVLRIPYALPLALLAGVGELIPVIGPILGTVPALILALFKSTWQFWSVLIIAVLLQKLTNLFLVPRVMGAKVSVSPLAVFIAFMIGGSLLGVIGGIMAIPAAAIVQVAFDEAFVQTRERRLDRDRAGSLLKHEG